MNYFKAFTSFFNHEMWGLEIFIEELEEHLKEKIELAENNYDDLDFEEKANVYEEFMLRKYTFPMHTMNPMLVIIMTYFERELKKQCVYADRESKPKIKVNDLKASDIERYYSFLEKVIEIDLSQKNDVWNRIQDIRKLRNCVVHYGSNLNEYIADKGNHLKVYIDKISYLEHYTKTGEVQIKDKAFLYDAIKDIKEYIVFVYDELGKKYFPKT